MTKQQLIYHIGLYAAPGTLKTANPDALQRRINSLAEIEFAAQEAREKLEAALDDRETEEAQP